MNQAPTIFSLSLINEITFKKHCRPVSHLTFLNWLLYFNWALSIIVQEPLLGSSKAIITSLKLGVNFNSLHFLMMPVFKKRKKIQGNWVAFRQGDLRVPELTHTLKTTDTKHSTL